MTIAIINEAIADAKSRMEKSVEALKRELASIRTGRANPSLVEHLMVDYYGVPTPLNQIASISVPEARLLLIQPWDKQVLVSIEKGILKSDLGLVPNNDGHVIRIAIPALNEERRRDLVRTVHKKAEDDRVAVRNVRRDCLEKLRALEKNKEISLDNRDIGQEQLQKITDAFIARVDQIMKDKEAEVMEV